MDDVIKEYDSQLNNIDKDLEKLEMARKEARENQRACETEDCMNKWKAKRRAIRTERKRLEKVRNEVSDEQYTFFKRKYK